jgi:hypothetical protein
MGAFVLSPKALEVARLEEEEPALELQGTIPGGADDAPGTSPDAPATAAASWAIEVWRLEDSEPDIMTLGEFVTVLRSKRIEEEEGSSCLVRRLDEEDCM